MIILLNCIINIIKSLLRRKRIIIQLNVNKIIIINILMKNFLGNTINKRLLHKDNVKKEF